MVDYLVKLFPIMIGRVVILENVPDQVFAERLVGDGIAIDPFTNVVYAPVDGVIKSIHNAKHAVTISSSVGFDILIHIGLDTVNLNGAGFTLLVKEGDHVRANDKIMEFDLDYLSLKARTLISPMLVCDIDEKKFKLDLFVQNNEITSLEKEVLGLKNVSLVKSDIQINNVDSNANSLQIVNVGGIKSEWVTIINATGIHARPAARLVQYARDIVGDIYLEKSGRKANLKSVTAILELSVQCGDKVRLITEDENSNAIIQSIIEMLSSLSEENSAKDTLSQKVLVHNSSNTIINNQYNGIIASSGLAVGKIVKSVEMSFDFVDFCDDVELEKQKLQVAIDSVAKQLNDSLIGLVDGSEHKNILNAHLMILTDPELLNEVILHIESKKSVARSLVDVVTKHCKILDNTGVELLKQRQVDLKDVCNRILANLNDVKHNVIRLESDSILIAKELTPSDILNLEANIVGLVSVNGGITSHVAILAKAKGIPLLINVVSDLLDNITNDDNVILDCNIGVLNLKPTVEDLSNTKQNIAQQKLKLATSLLDALKPCVTLDNVRIDCYANISGQNDINTALKNGADGVGLFRTEFIFLAQETMPSVLSQSEIYQAIANDLGNKPFVLRTLDAGGDKDISYLNLAHEINPMLGVRGIRLCLDNLELFKTQLTAILQTKADNLKIMLPMVSCLNEYRQTKELIKQLQVELRLSKKIELGIMVEVPAVAIMTDIFAKEVDFFSIGTNDLTQYTLAIDRENTKLVKLFDHLNPAVLRNIKLVVDGARKYDKPVSVCGMMASDKLALPVLLGLGVNKLSMDINVIADNKSFIRKLDIKQCEDIASQCLYLSSSNEVRELLASYYNCLL